VNEAIILLCLLKQRQFRQLLSFHMGLFNITSARYVNLEATNLFVTASLDMQLFPGIPLKRRTLTNYIIFPRTCSRFLDTSQ
jgi:hypothetical protein